LRSAARNLSDFRLAFWASVDDNTSALGQESGPIYWGGSTPAYDSGTNLAKGRCELALKVLKRAREVLAQTEFKHDYLGRILRAAAQQMGLKAGGTGNHGDAD
jgi:hypothetical protein